MALAGADIGTKFHSDQEVLTITNPRSDTSRLTGLTRNRDQLQTEIAVLEDKEAVLIDQSQRTHRATRTFPCRARLAARNSAFGKPMPTSLRLQAQYSTAKEALSRAVTLKDVRYLSAKHTSTKPSGTNTWHRNW